MFDLKNKNVIVTGAAGLLGSRFCDIILKHNGTPILLDLDKAKLFKISKKLMTKYKKEIFFYNLDITNELNIKKNSLMLLKKFKKIDALINNAAYNPTFGNSKEFLHNEFETFSIDQWNKEINVGLTGSFLCAKHYGKIIAKNKKGGSIINISSDLGLIGPNQDLYSHIKKNNKRYYKPVSYSVVKSGLIGLTKYLSTYWAKNNVRCNALCPGGIETDQSKIFLNKIHELIPLKRMAKKDEYLSTIIWMLSDKSSYLNGSIISVDGGRTAW